MLALSQPEWQLDMKTVETLNTKTIYFPESCIKKYQW